RPRSLADNAGALAGPRADPHCIHRTGHGIGVTTHEPPYMVEGEEQPLVPGMCFSVEPGIYLAGKFGVRIEDIVTVTADGGQRLNNTDHGLRIVE
ncbi:MAG TPA: M24 family metallopeptidase, partial [Propionibacteriaceae bacterium]|nr:M24 family metallopeptidase [Propionibacteriaceae bacterium]